MVIALRHGLPNYCAKLDPLERMLNRALLQLFDDTAHSSHATLNCRDGVFHKFRIAFVLLCVVNDEGLLGYYVLEVVQILIA